MEGKEHSYLTLDTNIIKGYNFNFQGKYLKHLEQLKKQGVKVIISDVVYQELIEHYSQLIEEQRVNCLKALDLASQLILKGSYDIEGILNELRGLSNIKELAKEKIDNYFSEIGASVIYAADYASINDVLSRYFERRPPFESKKQNEFKDAIALQTLEFYGDCAQKKIYTISEDQGWIKFCKDSQWLRGMSFKEAMSDINSHSGKYEGFIKEFAGHIFDKNSEFYRNVTNKLNLAISNDSPNLKKTALVYCEVSEAKINVKELVFRGKELDILFIDDTECTFTMPCRLDLNLKLTIDIFNLNPLYSSEDLPDWGVEPDRVIPAEVNRTFDFDILITLKGNWSNGFKEMKLEEVAYDYKDFSISIDNLL